MPEPLHYLGLREIARRIARRELSPVEVTDAVLAQVAAQEPRLHAFLWRNPAAARDAERAEVALAKGKPPGPLHGVPVTVKDMILTRAAPTTAGSRTFGDGLRADRDAPVVRRLRQAGATFLGKTTLHEIAMGVTTVNEHFGAARNPWDLERVAGGSSGGSAVAVAAGMGYGSVGTDTRGSIRIPSACCGVTGLKPTRGLVPIEGVVPLSWSLDHVGPMARSVEDVALLLGVMTGGRRLACYLAAVDQPSPRFKLGVCPYYLDRLDPPVEAAIRVALAVLERAGHTIETIRLDGLEEAHAASGVITGAEALTYHEERLRDHPDRFGPLVRARLEAARGLTAIDLVRAERVRHRTAAAFDATFREVDCLVAPVLPADAPRLEETVVRVGVGTEPLLDAFTRLNAPQNMAGVPALSLPCGLSPAGLPIGLQLIAARGREEVLLALGAHYQRETDWHLRRPPL